MAGGVGWVDRGGEPYRVYRRLGSVRVFEGFGEGISPTGGFDAGVLGGVDRGGSSDQMVRMACSVGRGCDEGGGGPGGWYSEGGSSAVAGDGGGYVP